MDSIIIGIEILVIIILIVLNGLFSLAEIAVVSTRRIRMQKIADDGDKRAVAVLGFMDNISDFLSTVQVGITFTAIITGAIKDRKSQQDKFMENDDCKILIATISAAGTGLTLTSATFAIFVDEPYTNAAYEQAADRIYRIGQNNKVTIISLIAKDTIDERVHKIMMKKKHISEAIVDKQYNLKDKKVLEWLLDG